ncbi:MAG TPA: hypothetical protein VMS56_01760 [Thermoanaerobaculia bacterium]|nr:hypothetical protein [Thermoanaerobaculia bacterium]
MSGTLVLIALALAIGAPLARLATRESNGGALLGFGLLFGSGAIGVLMFALSLIPGGWSRTAIVTAALVLAALAWAAAIRLAPAPLPPLPPLPPHARLLLAPALLILAGHALYATVAPAIEVDFLENWGLKGRIFWSHGAIDWEWLAGEAMWQNHPDYPILLPLLFAFVATVEGSWEDRAIGLLYTAWAAGVLLVAAAELRRSAPRSGVVVPVAVVSLASLAVTPWIGIADGLFLALAGGAALLLRRGTANLDAREIAAGSALLGLAAWTKNEGMTLVVAGAIAVIATAGWRPRLLAGLLPGIVLAGAWGVPRALLGLESDLAAGDPLGRVLEGIRSPGPLLAALGTWTTGRPLLWGGLLLGALVGARELLRRERLLLVLCGTQLAFYLLAYLATPHEIDWQVRWSWERLVSHVRFPLAFAVVVVLTAILVRGGGPEREPAPERES